jgi:VWFA-related protein
MTLVPSRRRASPILCLAALALLGGIGPAAAVPNEKNEKNEKSEQTEKSFQETLDVHLVDVDVVALDHNGNVVTDLARDDFQVTDDGKKVKFPYFARPGEMGAGATGAGGAPDRVRGPRQVILFVDLDSDADARNRVLDEVSRSLASLAGGVSAMVVTYGENGLHIEQPFSSSPAAWHAALAKAKEMSGRGAARRSEQQRLIERIAEVKHSDHGEAPERRRARQQLPELIDAARQVAAKTRAEGQATLKALQTLSSALAAVPGPKLLLYVGDGVPVRPGEDVFGLLGDLFQGDRSFEQGGGFSDAPPNPGTGPPPATGDEASRRAAAQDAERGLGPTMDSAESLRSEVAALDLSDELRTLTAIANSQRVTLYGVSSARPDSRSAADGRVAAIASIAYDDHHSREESLRRMAEDTGGLAIGADANIDTFLDRVMADPASFYSLGYVSPHGGDSGYHRIKVKIARKGVELRHRTGYIDRARDVRIGDVIAGALLFGSGENPHRVELEVLSQSAAENGQVAVTIGVSLPMAEIQLAPIEGRHEAKLELYVQSRDSRGRFAPLRLVDLTVAVPNDQLAAAKGKLYGAHLPLVLSKGTQTIAVGIVEPAAQRTSVARAVVEVAAAPAAPAAPGS